jgi:transcriptional regulator with XRE-family HTH domain
VSRINEDLILNIGQKFRVCREELFFTQRDVANMTGLTVNTIAAVERGKGTTLYNFLLICRALKIQPKKIFEEDMELVSLYDVEPESKRRIEITQKLDDLVYHSDFFDSPKRVSEVLEELKSDKNDSNKFSVYLTAYCKEDVLEYQKAGNFKRYKKKKKES